MQPQPSMGEVLSSLAARAGADGDLSLGPSTTAGVGGWVLHLLSLLALLVAGHVAAHLARRLITRATPELTALLNQSAAFYGRWPEDRLANAQRSELLAETARCRRIVEMLQDRTPADDRGPSVRGPIDGLQAWITLLSKRIALNADAPTSSSYA